MSILSFYKLQIRVRLLVILFICYCSKPPPRTKLLVYENLVSIIPSPGKFQEQRGRLSDNHKFFTWLLLCVLSLIYNQTYKPTWRTEKIVLKLKLVNSVPPFYNWWDNLNCFIINCLKLCVFFIEPVIV